METKFWKCDSCGKSIDNPKDGWIEWLRRSDNTAFGLRLVHHNATHNSVGCQYDESNYDSTLQDLPMTNFVGDYGLMELLSLIQEGQLPNDEILEMIKRLHISGYEKARGRISEAIKKGVFDPNSHPGIYSETQISLVNQWIDEGN